MLCVGCCIGICLCIFVGVHVNDFQWCKAGALGLVWKKFDTLQFPKETQTLITRMSFRFTALKSKKRFSEHRKKIFLL